MQFHYANELICIICIKKKNKRMHFLISKNSLSVSPRTLFFDLSAESNGSFL